MILQSIALWSGSFLFPLQLHLISLLCFFGTLLTHCCLKTMYISFLQVMYCMALCVTVTLSIWSCAASLRHPLLYLMRSTLIWSNLDLFFHKLTSFFRIKLINICSLFLLTSQGRLRITPCSRFLIGGSTVFFFLLWEYCAYDISFSNQLYKETKLSLITRALIKPSRLRWAMNFHFGIGSTTQVSNQVMYSVTQVYIYLVERPI